MNDVNVFINYNSHYINVYHTSLCLVCVLFIRQTNHTWFNLINTTEVCFCRFGLHQTSSVQLFKLKEWKEGQCSFRLNQPTNQLCLGPFLWECVTTNMISNSTRVLELEQLNWMEPLLMLLTRLLYAFSAMTRPCPPWKQPFTCCGHDCPMMVNEGNKEHL